MSIKLQSLFTDEENKSVSGVGQIAPQSDYRNNF
jgi:hypothetical protein